MQAQEWHHLILCIITENMLLFYMNGCGSCLLRFIPVCFKSFFTLIQCCLLLILNSPSWKTKRYRYLLGDQEQQLRALWAQPQSSTQTAGRWRGGSGGSAVGPHPTGTSGATEWATELHLDPEWGGTTQTTLRKQAQRVHNIQPTNRGNIWYSFKQLLIHSSSALATKRWSWGNNKTTNCLKTIFTA